MGDIAHVEQIDARVADGQENRRVARARKKGRKAATHETLRNYTKGGDS